MKTVTLTLLTCSTLAHAQTPQLGGPMEHVMVHLHGTMLHAHAHASGLVMQNHGQTYAGAAGVLNGTHYNAQYGWMIEGFWSPPAGAHLWIEQTAATEGLLAYRGGNMMNPGDFQPIFGADGSDTRILWDGSMLHNWYAASDPGLYTATYSVYFGDAAGVPLDGYQAGAVELSWVVVPAPGTAGLLAACALAGARRERRTR